ncbi:MAG: hypothetical protein ACRDR6_24985 [Pseudonocardiaceae bacterium]
MVEPHTVLGVWEVWADGAPFDHHVMMFHADGTMVQSNPDSGNAESSDSAGMGDWRAEGDDVVGRFLETRADRTTHLALGRTVVRFTLRVVGNRFTGRAVATVHDRGGALVAESAPAVLRATRFTAD